MSEKPLLGEVIDRYGFNPEPLAARSWLWHIGGEAWAHHYWRPL